MFREEYPRPSFARKEWACLNGIWDFEFDDNNIGMSSKWYKKDHKLTKKINVPFVFQSKLSNINTNDFHDFIWYKRTFKVKESWKNKDILLHFGAVDYRCFVFINGELVGSHEGGHTSFHFNISSYLNWNEEEITVYAEDPSNDETIPRGKQFWLEKPDSIWYKRSSGIWQSVWLEPVSKTHIEEFKCTPLFDDGSVKFNIKIKLPDDNMKIMVKIMFENTLIVQDIINIYDAEINRIYDIFQKKVFRGCAHGSGWTWSPENPNLFDVKLTLMNNDEITDEVNSYFGMRKIHTEGGKVYLNNRPYYQRLVLDQGYWPESLMTAPSDEDFKKDITLAKKMGFNGCRKHQKIEDPRFLYWADKLGYLVWSEMPSTVSYDSCSVSRITNEWIESVKRDYNHPCIVTWVVLNESWGVSEINYNKMQQSHSLSLYYMLHSLDNTRPVISNDGWELTKTDICAIHNYQHGTKDEKEKYEKFIRDLSTKEEILKSQPSNRSIYANGFEYTGEPVLLTEFGGIGYDTAHPEGWGYTVASDEREFIDDLERVFNAVRMSDVLNGFCYTQFTDVEQEVNGLLTYSREPKCDPDIIKKIVEK
jgi:beta-galactosidase/beta-glucuronidase